MTLHTIQLSDVEMALLTAGLRSRTRGKTALMAAYTQRPVVNVDCHRGTTPSAAALNHAKREGMRTRYAELMERGHIAQVIERTRNRHGLAGVRKTFKAGMKELAREHTFFLHVGKREGVNHGL